MPFLLPVLALLLAQSPAKATSPAVLQEYWAPDAPERQLLHGQEATVACTADLTATGGVSSVSCEAGKISPDFLEAARAAVSRWRFAEGAAGTRVRAQVVFALTKKAEPLPAGLPGLGKVSGVVGSATDGAPIAGAWVVAQGLGIGVQTDAAGRFELWLPKGGHALVAASRSRRPALERIWVSPESTSELRLALSPEDQVQPAQLANFQAADYPLPKLWAGQEAAIPCSLWVGATGEVLRATCDSKAADEELVRSAIIALEGSTFVPEKRNGKPVSSQVDFTYRFVVAADSPLAAPPPPSATHATVHGVVRTAGGGPGLAQAEVVAAGLGVAMRTDEHGRFSFTLPAGSHLLIASSAGYSPALERVEVKAGDNLDLDLFPRRMGGTVLEAKIEGTRERTAPVKTTLTREELRNVPGSQDDPVRVLENLPGLARIPFQGGQLIVRGANAEDTGAYIDGQKIPILYHLQNGPSVLGQDMVDRIDLFAGGAGVTYGNNLAGVVTVKTRGGDPERWHGGAFADLLKYGASLRGPLGDSTQIAVGGRHSYINPIFKFFFDGTKAVTLPAFWDYQGRLDHKLTKADKLALTVYGSDDSSSVLGDVSQGASPLADRHLGFHRVALAWNHASSPTLDWTVAPHLGFDVDNDRVVTKIPGVADLPQHSRTSAFAYGGRAEVRWRPSDAFAWHAGLDSLVTRSHYDIDQLVDFQLRGVGAPNSVSATRVGDRAIATNALFAELSWKAGRFELTPGLRGNLMSWNGHQYLVADPRFWLRYSMTESSTLFGYAGVYHQAPLAQQLDPVIGNPGLTPLRGNQSGAGVEHKLGGWTLRGEGFVNERLGLVSAVNPSANPDGTFNNPLLLNVGHGHSIGFEVLIRRELTSNFYGWLAYTLSRSREQLRPGEEWQPTLYDQPHIVTLLMAYRTPTNIEISARGRVATGNPYAEAVGATFNADSGSYVPTLRPFGAARMPWFFQLDLEVNNVWTADLYDLSLYVDFQNLAGRINPEQVLYGFDYTENHPLHGLPFLASVGAKVRF